MDLWSLLNEEEEKQEPEKVKEVKKEVEQVADQQPAPVVEAKKQATEEQKQATVQATETAEKPQKEEKPAGKKATKKKTDTAVKHKYPFGVYSEGRLIDVSSYGFVDAQEYTEDEITKIMLQHRHYEFSGKMEYNLIKDDNVLVANAAQHRKG